MTFRPAVHFSRLSFYSDDAFGVVVVAAVRTNWCPRNMFFSARTIGRPQSSIWPDLAPTLIRCLFHLPVTDTCRAWPISVLIARKFICVKHAKIMSGRMPVKWSQLLFSCLVPISVLSNQDGQRTDLSVVVIESVCNTLCIIGRCSWRLDVLLTVVPHYNGYMQNTLDSAIPFIQLSRL